MQADWDLKTEKLAQLRHDFAIATDTATKFKLQHDIDAEETQLAQLTTQLDDIEQALERDKATPLASAPSEANQLWAEPKEQWQDETWQKYTLEWLYHSLCAAPQAQLGMALGGCLVASKHLQKLQAWSDMVMMAGNATGHPMVKYLAERWRDGLQAYEDKDYKTVIDLLSLLLQAPQLEAAWRSVAVYWRGVMYAQANDYERSLQDLTEAISLAPEDADYWVERGRTYRMMERYDEAIADFNRAIEIDANNKRAIANRGWTYRFMACYEEALTDLNRAIELNANFTWAIAQRGLTYRLMERYEEALIDLSRAIELDARWIVQRGTTYRWMKLYNKAITDLNRAIELDADNQWAITLRGMTYQEMKRYEEALPDLNRAIELNADDQWAIMQRGETYLLKGQADEALQDLTQAITLNPKRNWCPYLRALAHLKLNQLQLAQTDLATAIQLAQPKYEQNPTEWRNTFNLALYHFAADHTDTANTLYRQSLIAPAEWLRMGISDLQEFLTLFPDHAQAQQMVALLQSTLEAKGNGVWGVGFSKH